MSQKANHEMGRDTGAFETAISEIEAAGNMVWLLHARWFESAIRIEAGFVKHNIEFAVAECPAGWIQIEFFDCVGRLVHRFPGFRVKPEGVIAQSELRGFDLFEDVSLCEQEKIVSRHTQPMISIRL